MSPPITYNGDEISAITYDGDEISEVTYDGDLVFSTLPPDSGADHQWNFTAGSGTTVTDVNGSLDASFTGISWQTGAGVEDAYALLDGSGDRGDLGTTSRSVFSSWIRNGVGTFSVWARLDDTGTGLQPLFAGTEGGNQNIEFWYRTGPEISLRVGNSSDNANIIDLRNVSISVSQGEWKNYAVTSDGTTARMVIDGTELATASVNTSELVSRDFDDNINLGGQSDYPRYWNGGYDVAWFSPSSSTVSELQSWYNDTKSLYP